MSHSHTPHTQKYLILRFIIIISKEPKLFFFFMALLKEPFILKALHRRYAMGIVALKKKTIILKHWTMLATFHIR